MTSKRLVGLLAMVLMSAQAFAMRVGDLQSQSRLNEPLRASIVLGDLSKLEAQNLDVRVADTETYERLGLERGSAVEGLNFQLNPRDGKDWQLDIIGNRAIREPFVVLLLDIRTTSGRALREFTVLLDPGPVLSEEEVNAMSDEVAAENAAVPAPESYSIASPGSDVPFTALPASPRNSKPVAGNQPMVSSKDYQYAKQQAAAASEYGPVRSGESLSSIANQLVDKTGAQVAQVMWALYESNPQAFDGSINNLKRGAQLQVPASSEIKRISTAQARLNIRDAAAETAVAGSQQTQPQQAAVTPKPVQNRLSDEVLAGDSGYSETPDAGSEVATNAGTDRMQPDMASADAESTGADPAASAASAASPAVETFAEEETFEVEEPSNGAPKVVMPGSTSNGGIFAAIGDWLLPILGAIVAIILLLVLVIRSRNKKEEAEAFVTETEAGQPRPDLVGMARGEPVPDPTEHLPVADDDEATVVLDAAPLADEDAAATEAAKIDDAFADFENLDLPESEELATEKLSEDEEFAALLQAEPAAPESADSGSNGDLGELDVDFGEPPAEGNAEAPAAAEPKSMFETASFPLVDDDAEAKTAASSDDPVAEAEFQLAYGLYDEAEQTLKTVLEAEPGRLDAMEKLAEVYFAAGRENEFEALAKELKRDQSMTQEFRNVEALAHQLIPNSTLFDQQTDAETEAPTEVSESAAGVVDAGDEIAADATAEEPEIEMVAFDMPEEEPAENDTPQVPETQTDEKPFEDDPAHTVEFVIPDVASEAVEDVPVAEGAAVDLGGSIDELEEISLEPAAETIDADASSLDLEGLSLEEGELEDSELEAQSFDFDEDSLNLESLEGDAEELSLDDLTLEDATAEAGAEEAAESVEFTLDDLDTGADDAELTIASDESDDSSTEGELTLEDLDTSSADDELLSMDDGGSTAADSDAFTVADLEAGSDDDSLLLEMPEETPAEDTDAVLDSFDDGINDGGDMNGKLDLARGYVDMGEIDMARSLLDEVVTRGNEDQQAEARAMLESLA